MYFVPKVLFQKLNKAVLGKGGGECIFCGHSLSYSCYFQHNFSGTSIHLHFPTLQFMFFNTTEKYCFLNCGKVLTMGKLQGALKMGLTAKLEELKINQS